MKNVDKTIEEMKEMVSLLWKNEEDVYTKVAEQMPEWKKTLEDMIEYMNMLQSRGMIIPVEVIFQQLNNLNEALRKKDDYMLADVLEFEVTETLHYYKELMTADE